MDADTHRQPSERFDRRHISQFAPTARKRTSDQVTGKKLKSDLPRLMSTSEPVLLIATDSEAKRWLVNSLFGLVSSIVSVIVVVVVAKGLLIDFVRSSLTLRVSS